MFATGGELVSGINSFTKGSGAGGNIRITGDRLNLTQGALIAADSQGIGQAGDISIHTQESLKLDNGGLISVDGGQVGFPGDIEIQSKDIMLHQGSEISATTTQGVQGNINLIGDNLWLRDRSKIVTNATRSATGGNINLALADNLAVLNSSQIAANAEQGQGGNIGISARGIFVSGDSEINASSEFGIDGLIQIDTFTENPDSGLIEFAIAPIDPHQYLVPGCNSDSDSKFVSIGKGGLPTNPLTSVIQDNLLPDWGGLAQSGTQPYISQTNSNTSIDHSSSLSRVEPIIEAENWKINQFGQLELIATSKNNYSLEVNGCLNTSNVN